MTYAQKIRNLTDFGISFDGKCGLWIWKKARESARRKRLFGFRSPEEEYYNIVTMKILPRPDKKKEWCHLYCRACGLLIFLGVIGVLYFPADTTPFFSVQIRPIAKSLKKGRLGKTIVIGVILSATFFGLYFAEGAHLKTKLRYKTVTNDLFDTNLFLCFAMTISKLVLIYAMLRRSIPAHD